MPTLEEVEAAITNAGTRIVGRKEPSPGHTQIAVEGLDGVVNVWANGTCSVQGRHADALKQLLGDLVGSARRRAGFTPVTPGVPAPTRPSAPAGSPRVFVVYGHDKPALDELDAILRRWGLEPLILQNLPSGGSTIIEKLEHYQADVDWAIVLMTPDDLGHPALEPVKAAPRPRQNVVLEFGMLLGKLGRERVAVLYKRSDPQMELPSDMHGYIYIPWTSSVSEARGDLAREMAAAGFFEVPPAKL